MNVGRIERKGAAHTASSSSSSITSPQRPLTRGHGFGVEDGLELGPRSPLRGPAEAGTTTRAHAASAGPAPPGGGAQPTGLQGLLAGINTFVGGIQSAVNDLVGGILHNVNGMVAGILGTGAPTPVALPPASPPPPPASSSPSPPSAPVIPRPTRPETPEIQH